MSGETKTERQWNKYEFQWEKKVNGVWVKDAEAKPKDKSDKQFIIRWIEHMKQDKTLTEFCRGWNYPKKKALDRRRRLNEKFADKLKPLKRLRKPKREPTDAELRELIDKLLAAD